MQVIASVIRFQNVYFRFYRKIRSSEQIFHLKWLFKNSVLSHWQTQLSCFWLFESCIFDVTTSTFSRRRNTSRATWLICRLRLSSFRISVHIFLLFMNHIILPASKFLSLKAHASLPQAKRLTGNHWSQEKIEYSLSSWLVVAKSCRLLLGENDCKDKTAPKISLRLCWLHSLYETAKSETKQCQANDLYFRHIFTQWWSVRKGLQSSQHL